jgi:DNA replication protein DnaC
MAESQNDRPAPHADRHCDRHGGFVAQHVWRDRYSSCPDCTRQQEAERAALEAALVARERAERNAEILARRLRISGIKKRFQEAGFDNFEVTEPTQANIVAACRKFAETFDRDAGGGLWLIGPPGTGKTHLGCAMVDHVVRHGNMAATIRGVHEIMAMLRERWGVKSGPAWESDGIDTELELLDYLGRVPLLVLDEVGIGRGNNEEMRILFGIIDARYGAQLPTILLSNLKPAGIKEAVGDRSYDRLREGARLLALDWPSHRGRAPC